MTTSTGNAMMRKVPDPKSEFTEIGEAVGTFGATLAFMLNKVRELEDRLSVLERAQPYDPYPNKGAKP